jgi:hypothetical protein
MSDYSSHAFQPMDIHAGFCSQDGRHVYLYAGHVCLSFSHEEFVRLAHVVRETARALQERGLPQAQQHAADNHQAPASLPLLRTDDPATQLAGALCLLQAETDPARIEKLHRIAVALDEEVRQQVRQYARERAARAQKKEG